MAFLGSNIVFRNTSNRNDFGDVASLKGLKTRKRGSVSKSDGKIPVDAAVKTRKKRRPRRHLYFHVHLDGEGAHGANDSSHETDDDSAPFPLKNSEDDTASYKSFISVKKSKEAATGSSCNTIYIDRALPSALRKELALSCERMGFATGKASNSLLWWCSSTRDKTIPRIKEMVEKLNVNKSNVRSRASFFCGMRYSLHKVNLASKFEMYSLLLGSDSFEFVSPTFILPRQRQELEQLMQLQRGKTKKVIVRVRNKNWKPPVSEAIKKRIADVAASGSTLSDATGSEGSSSDSSDSLESRCTSSESSDDDSLYDEDGFPIIEQSDESDGETEAGIEYDEEMHYVGDMGVNDSNAEHFASAGKGTNSGLSDSSLNTTDEYVEKIVDECDEDVYIVKPSGGKQGMGIILFQGWNGWKTLISKGNRFKKKILQNCVVQRYISNPFLLQDGVKFDLRLYVLIESLLPMKAYLCTEGLCRFATIPYERASNRNLHKRRMHLTNYSINRGSSFFTFSESFLNPQSLSDSRGSKRTLSSVLSILDKMGRDSKKAMRDIRRLLGKTCAVLQAELIYIQQRMLSSPASDNRGFHLLGFDVMWDENLKPYLLEVNAHPSLRTDFQPSANSDFTMKSPVDEYVKRRVIDGALSILKYSYLQKQMKGESSNKKKNKHSGSKKSNKKLSPIKRRPSKHKSAAAGKKSKGPVESIGNDDFCDASSIRSTSTDTSGQSFRSNSTNGSGNRKVEAGDNGKQPSCEDMKYYYYEKIKFDPGSMHLIRCGKQMLNLFGRLSENSDTEYLSKTSFIRFFQMASTMKKVAKQSDDQGQTTANTSPTKKTLSSPLLSRRLTTTELDSMYDRIVHGNGTKSKKNRVDVNGTKTKTNGQKGDATDTTSLARATKTSVLKHSKTLTQMTFPDFCRALMEIAALSYYASSPQLKRKKSSSLLEVSEQEFGNQVQAVQEFLQNIELISSQAEKAIGSRKLSNTKGIKSDSKTDGNLLVDRRHSLGYLMALSQKLEIQKERKFREKIDMKNREMEKKEREVRGKEARQRVIKELRKRRQEKLQKEKAFYDEIQKEREKERRKSEFENWMTQKKATTKSKDEQSHEDGSDTKLPKINKNA